MADATPAWPGICFDSISHDWMIANIPMDKVILRKWLKAGYVYQNELFPSHAGTPQCGFHGDPATRSTRIRPHP